MVSQRRYRLKQHHTFEQDDRKYVVDLETGDLIPLKDVEWDILSRYASQTRYQIVETLKEQYKLTDIFEGIERLERLGQQGSVLSPIIETAPPPSLNRPPKLLVPFHFTGEKSSLDYLTNFNRYQFLTHLAGFAELETLAFLEEKKEAFQDLDAVRVRNIDVPKSSALASPWYAMEGYDGILLLSQFVKDDLLYYRIPDVPIVHCIEGAQRLQHVLPSTLLTLSAFQSPKHTLVVSASWMKEWLAELGAPVENVQVIPSGIDIVAPIGDKALAKQYTASLFDKPMFIEKPVVGLISGFEPSRGAVWISEFARANPHLAIFVYDTLLEQEYRQPPENVVIFSADDEETRSVLPIFFQALDLVCFPAMPGTPLSVILEAMAYGAPCVVMTKYGMPPEVAGAGVVVKSEGNDFSNFRVPMSELSNTVNQWLKPSHARTECEDVAKRLAQKFTWEKVAQEIVQCLEEGHQQSMNDFRRERNVSPSVFCRRYDPGTGTTESSVYRVGTHRYDCLKTALIEMLAEQHTPAEIEAVFKHFQGKGFTSVANEFVLEMAFPTGVGKSILPEKKHRQKGEKPK
jgi:glycosyltransferase involved in cell wall biosynthesis